MPNTFFFWHFIEFHLLIARAVGTLEDEEWNDRENEIESEKNKWRFFLSALVIKRQRYNILTVVIVSRVFFLHKKKLEW